ncbi:MAG: hypothetical protein ACLKAK_12855 [Alkaliphilus sp.]
MSRSLRYSIIEKSTALAIGGALVSVIAVMLGLPPVNLIQAVSTTIGVLGFLVFVRDISINNYNVYYYGDKFINIGNTTPYRAGRTVKWNAVVADLGASLDFRYENVDYDYWDNKALLNQGITNYLRP